MGRGPVTYRAPHLRGIHLPQEALSPDPYALPKDQGISLPRAPPLTALPAHPQQNTFPRVLSWLFLNELSSLLASGTPQDTPPDSYVPANLQHTKTIKSVNTFQQPTAEGNWQACSHPADHPHKHITRLTPYLLRQNTPTPTENIHSHKVPPQLSSNDCKNRFGTQEPHCTPKTPTS